MKKFHYLFFSVLLCSPLFSMETQNSNSLQMPPLLVENVNFLSGMVDQFDEQIKTIEKDINQIKNFSYIHRLVKKENLKQKIVLLQNLLVEKRPCIASEEELKNNTYKLNIIDNYNLTLKQISENLETVFDTTLFFDHNKPFMDQKVTDYISNLKPSSRSFAKSIEDTIGLKINEFFLFTEYVEEGKSYLFYSVKDILKNTFQSKAKTIQEELTNIENNFHKNNINSKIIQQQQKVIRFYNNRTNQAMNTVENYINNYFSDVSQEMRVIDIKTTMLRIEKKIKKAEKNSIQTFDETAFNEFVYTFDKKLVGLQQAMKTVDPAKYWQLHQKLGKLCSHFNKVVSQLQWQ